MPTAPHARTSTPTGTRDRLDRGTVLALLAMALGVFVVANDVTALSVALPAIEREFDSDVSTVQWVINAYALVFGVLIVTGGRLADLFGRQRAFFAGAAVFVVFSLIGGAAQSIGWLIGARALMGIGGALMWPALLGMTYEALPESRAGLAGGLIIGAAGFGNAVGPLLGGLLTDTLGWRWILFVNLPIALTAALVIWRQVHQPRVQAARERIDYPGIATLSLGLVALLLALDQSSAYGWSDPRILALLGACVVLLGAFAVIEARAGASALVPCDVMSNRQFTSACVAVLLVSPTFFASLLYLPQFMQKLLDYTPLQAGLGLLPMMGLFAIVSFAAGSLYERFGAKLVVGTGAACLALGMFLLSLVSHDSGWTGLVPGMAVVGVGVALFYSSVTTAGVTALDPSRSSLAGGIVYMFQIAGGSIGLGLTTAVFTASSQSALREDARSLTGGRAGGEVDAVQGILAGTESGAQALAQFGANVAARLESLVREAFVSGFQAGLRLDAALALAGFLVAVAFIGGGRSSRAP